MFDTRHSVIKISNLCWAALLALGVIGASVCQGQNGTPVIVSTLVTVTTANEKTTFDRTARMLRSTADITITNSSQQNILIPLHAVIEITNVSYDQVQMPGALGGPGTEPYGKYYYDLSDQVTNGGLLPGQSIQFDAQFLRRSLVHFTYSVSTRGVLSTVTNLPPVANAGPNRELLLLSGTTSIDFQLDGSSSYDSDGVITGYVWTGTPDPGDTVQPTVSLAEGTYVFTLVVTDDRGSQSSPSTVTIQVLPGSSLRQYGPQVSVNPLEFTLNQGETLEIPVSGSHPNGEFVSLSASPVMNNASFTSAPGAPATGTFRFTPDAGQTGIFLVYFTVRDSLGFTDTKTIKVIVNRVNQPPILSVQPAATVNEGGILTVLAQASDPNGDILTLFATGLPNNATFVPATGTLTFTPDYTQGSPYPYLITITASDGELSASQTVAITVFDVPTGGQTGPRDLSLSVDPAENPTFLTNLRITGAVNATGDPPSLSKSKSALITGMSPATGEQGSTIEVALTGESTGNYATHFVNQVSQASFGAGITMNSATVATPSQVTVNLSIGPTSSEGARSVTVTTGSETAISLIAFNVTRGKCRLTGGLVDSDTGLPISGGMITVQGTPSTTLTDAKGIFTLTDPPSGKQNLLINAANYEFIRFTVNLQPGITVDLGKIPLRSLVFDPSAPASVSLMSVLGRGVGEFIPAGNREKTRQLIRDVILLIGGSEAGVLDEYKNQINPNITGDGMVSLTPAGIDWIADRMGLGATISLQEILYGFSFAYDWTSPDPITLQEWLSGLQSAVDRAWQDPNHSDSLFPILIFNKGKGLLPLPPVLSPYTRLNSLQAHILISSFLAYTVDRLYQPDQSYRALGIMKGDRLRRVLPVQDSPDGKTFTRFWRNFFTAKGDYPNSLLKHALLTYNTALLIVSSYIPSAMFSYPGVLNLALYGGTVMGIAASELNSVLKTMGELRKIPDAPVISNARQVTTPDGKLVVDIIFKRSKSDDGKGPNVKFLYTLYRFSNSSESRTVAGHSLFPGVNENLVIRDPDPLEGTYFYAMTVTRWESNGDLIGAEQISASEPLWGLPNAGQPNPLVIMVRVKKALTSDYSAPFALFIGALPIAFSMDSLKIDPRVDQEYAYYSDSPKGAIYRIEAGGEGERSLFANTNFKASIKDGREVVQVGLAIDSLGNLYSENAASDAQFGGRVFRFLQPNGAREFSGSLNYFSQLLMFANPVSAGPMAICPNWGLFNGDLFVVEEMTRMILRVPVNATYDVNRRVGQPYVPIPSTAGRIIDMTFDKNGNLYLLGMNEMVKVIYDPDTGTVARVETIAKLRP